ncbi:hypothetical protein [Paenibacillus sp. KS-LC4]|uniref:hypothetical protein n=1 Tax=Paenibacillus sp. KS-LC4 TaxID=2979727 RepID=UPI0030D5FF22
MNNTINEIPENSYFYGPYNCTMNAVGLYLLKHNISIDAIYSHNFNFSCSFDNKTISGSMSNQSLFDFVKEYYNIELKENGVDGIPTNEYFMVTVDVFYVPGNSYYNKHHSGHSMLAYLSEDGIVNINDPYLKIHEHMPLESFLNTLVAGRPIYTFVSLPVSDRVASDKGPYILNKDYKVLYKHAEQELYRILEGICSNLDDEFNVEAFFGGLRTLEIARENYFRAVEAPEEYVKKIKIGWKKTLMNYIRMKKNAKYLDDIKATIQDVLEDEIKYLDSLHDRSH